MATKSKYTFAEVEARLDAIKFDQGQNKVLRGDGTYGEVPAPTGTVTSTGITKIEPIDRAAFEALPRPLDTSIMYVVRG